MPAETQTFPLDYVVEHTGAPSEDWLRRKINQGLLPARKAGRHWRMTESDMAAVVDLMAVPARIDSSSIAGTAAETRPDGTNVAGLTPRARKRIRQSA